MADPKFDKNDFVMVTFRTVIRRSRKDGLEHEWKRVVKECGGVTTVQVQSAELADHEELRTRDFDRTQGPRRPDEKKPVTIARIFHSEDDDGRR